MSSETPRIVKSRAHALVSRTGMNYNDAVRIVDRDRARPLRGRWLLSEDLRGWFHGDGWYANDFGDLYAWLDNMDTDYPCRTCGRPGDALTEDSSLVVTVSAYDPDTQPSTVLIGADPHHATCCRSALRRSVLVVGWDGAPCIVTLPSEVRPDLVGEFRITATPFQSEDPEMPPVLILTPTLIEDHDYPEAVAWFHQMEIALRSLGFWDSDSMPFEEPPVLTLRVVPGENPWLALRTTPVTRGQTPDHLYLGPPEQGADFDRWAARAVEDALVLVAVGPLAKGGDLPEFPLAGREAGEIDEVLFDADGEHYFLSRTVFVADPADLAGPLTTGRAFADYGFTAEAVTELLGGDPR